MTLTEDSPPSLAGVAVSSPPQPRLQPRSRVRFAALSTLISVGCGLALYGLTPAWHRSVARFEFLPDPDLPPAQGIRELVSRPVRSAVPLAPWQVGARALPGTPGPVAEVTVRHRDAAEAARLLGALAEAYQRHRDAVAREVRLPAATARERAVTEATSRLDSARTDLEALTLTLDEARSQYGTDLRSPWRHDADLDAALAERATLQRQIADLGATGFPDSLHVANRHRLINADRMAYVAEYLGTMSTVASLGQAGFPDTHADVIRAKRRTQELRVQLEGEITDLLASLRLKETALAQRATTLLAERDAGRASLEQTLAAWKVAETNHREAQEHLRVARIALAEVQALLAAPPPALVVHRMPAATAAAPSRPRPVLGFLLASPFLGLGLGLLLPLPRRRNPGT